MNALKLLTADHKEVERLFKECEVGPRAKKRELFFVIKTALETHAWVEETIFYPTLQSEGDRKLIELTSEAIKEHIGMKCFEPLLTKLIEDVRHHVKEEEGTMFPAVQKRLSADALDVLGAQMEAEKKRFQSSAETIYG